MAQAPEHEVPGSASEGCCPLPFGIPSLDELLALDDEAQARACLKNCTSLAIVGQDGTGKSVFALHLASAYLSLAWKAMRSIELDEERTAAARALTEVCVLYASSDLSYTSASKVWDSFGLGIPGLRYTPFISADERNRRLEHELVNLSRRQTGDNSAGGTAFCQIDLEHLVPRGPGPQSGEERAVPDFLAYPRGEPGTPAVGLLDLTDYSAGDDWMYLCRLVANQPAANPLAPKNLLIVDSIEGFETLIGERNSFGERMSRRARIAQLVRAASNDWHLVFLVEEPSPGHRHPEEYVADSVIRLRRSSKGETVRRWVEIEKSRGRAYSPGEHPFDIRSGRGTSTGEWENPDDPMTLPHPKVLGQFGHGRLPPQFGYVQVFPSLGHLSKQFAQRVLDEQQLGNHWASRRDGFADFGIENLDNLLGATDKAATIEQDEDSPPQGLTWGSINSLTGNGGTHRKALAKQFLFQSFASFPGIFECLLGICAVWVKGQCPVGEHPENEEARHEELLRAKFLSWFADELEKALPAFCANDRISRRTEQTLRARFIDPFRAHESKPEVAAGREDNRKVRSARALTLGRLLSEQRYALRQGFRAHAAPRMSRWDEGSYFFMGDEKQAERLPILASKALGLAFALLRSSLGVLDPVVLVTTEDVSSKALVDRLLKAYGDELLQICERVIGAGFSDDGHTPEPGREAVLWHFGNTLERYFIVRRLEHVDISAPQLWHVIQQCVSSAKGMLGLKTAAAAQIEEQFTVGAIRLVIGDLHLMRQMYPDFARETLFVPMLAFWLQRQSVTTLLINSPDGADTAKSSGSSELSMLAARQIHTWEVEFFGERRVAISVTPPMADRSHALVRELRRLDRRSPDTGNRLPALDVDPHFELYSGIERGEARPVPLRISLWRDTDVFDAYAQDEERMLSRMFTPVEPGGTVLESLRSNDYDAIKDFVHLPDETRLDHTHVFAVNGYWALNRDNSLESQARYLNAHLQRREKPDVFELFDVQQTQANGVPTRLQAHQQIGADGRAFYRARIPAESTTIDRVPFTWDFAFLMLDGKFAKESWLRDPKDSAARALLGHWQACEPDPGREEPARDLPRSPGWAEFFRECVAYAARTRDVEGRRILPFAQGRNNSSVLLGLFLEVWLSEVLEDIASPAPLGGEGWKQFALQQIGYLSTEFFQGVFKDQKGKSIVHEAVLEDLLGIDTGGESAGRLLAQAISAACKGSAQGRPSAEGPEKGKGSLERTFVLQLLRAWALIHGVYARRNGGDGLVSAVDETESDTVGAAATRHYYTTACEVQCTAKESALLNKQGTPAYGAVTRLPGRFTTRGDWFLATAKGSRSVRLADRALDILSSKRANRSRLERGLGLPTRPLLDERSSYAGVRTALMTLDGDQAKGVNYEHLVKMGAGFLVHRGPDRAGERSDADAGPVFHFGQDAKSIDALNNTDYFWLFRSGFRNFDRFEPLLRQWVHRVAVWSDRLSHEPEQNCMLGFELYEALRKPGEVTEPADQQRLLSTVERFGGRLDGLLMELKECRRRYQRI